MTGMSVCFYAGMRAMCGYNTCQVYQNGVVVLFSDRHSSRLSCRHAGGICVHTCQAHQDGTVALFT